MSRKCEISNRRLRVLARVFAILASLILAESSRAQTLELGLLPSLSTRTLFDVYRPLREHLAHHLGRDVRLVTAPDYATLIARTRRGEYAYLVTAPHFARLAQHESGYLPLVRVERELSAVVVTPRRDGVMQLRTLRGEAVSSPDRLAIVSMLGHQIFNDAGLVPGSDFALVPYPSFPSAVLAASTGEVAAAVTAITALNQMPGAMSDRMMVIAESPVVPAVMVIARGDTPAAERDQITRLLLGFHRTAPGKAFFTRTRFKNYRIPTNDELASLDPYVARLKAVLLQR